MQTENHSWSEWENEFQPTKNWALVWHAVWSKTNLVSDTGVYEYSTWRTLSFSQGRHAVADMQTIEACVAENIHSGYKVEKFIF
jgi:hypothetical protein